MEMTVKEVLIAARAKIADPANWAKGSFATDKNGSPVWETSKDACRFCSAGAVYLACREFEVGYPAYVVPSHSAINALNRVMGDSVGKFNDTHTHAEVLAKFDEAIAAQGGE